MKVEVEEGEERNSPLVEHPPPSPPSPAQSPLTVKLFRATSAACLINFSFLQITIFGNAAALLNHITTTSYGAVYLLLGSEGGRERGRERGREGGGVQRETKAAQMIALYLNHISVLF